MPMTRMKTVLRTFLAIILIAIAIAFALRRSHQPNPTSPSHNVAAETTSPPASLAPSPPNASAPTAVQSSMPAGRPRALAPRQEPVWPPRVSGPAFARFAEWVEQYRHAAPDEQSRLEAEGVTLAKARLGAMADLIRTDPEQALQQAVPQS